MKLLALRLPVLLLLAITVISCRSAPPYHVDAQGFATQSAPIEKRAEQIKRAGIGLNWLMTDLAPGQMRGKLDVRSSTVIVLITFAPETYSINFDQGTTRFEGESVHKRYNVWVKELEKAIYRNSQT